MIALGHGEMLSDSEAEGKLEELRELDRRILQLWSLPLGGTGKPREATL